MHGSNIHSTTNIELSNTFVVDNTLVCGTEETFCIHFRITRKSWINASLLLIV